MAKRKKSQRVDIPPSNAIVDDEHSTLVTWVNESDDATSDSRQLSEKCRDYYDSRQWEADEISKLKKQKQAATVINRIKPKADALMGMERANRTTAKAWPRTPKHSKGASAATEAVRYCLQDNMYSRARSDSWDNMVIEGTGGLDVTVIPTESKEMPFKVLIKHIKWDRLIYDPHSRRKDFSDARYLGQVVWMDYDQAVEMYPDAEDVLKSMLHGSQTYDDKPRWMDTTRERVKIVEMYYEKKGDWYYACFTRGGYCKKPQKSPYVNEEGETEHCYEFASLFVDREGGRYGALRQILDIQDEINKRRSKALHLMSVRQVRWERGAVDDINKARQELAKPDGVLETTPGMEFEILKTGDMAAAQFNLLTEAKAEIDAIGANAATQGKDKTVQSGVALRQRELTGQTELAPMFDMLKNLDIRVYRKVWNRVKQYWKAEMWLRVTDDENNLKFVGLNKPITRGQLLLQQAQAEGATPEQLAVAQQRIASDPSLMEVVSTENEIANLDVDIVMDDAPDTVTQEVEDFQAMAEMVKSGFPLPPEAVIMASPLSNKDKIIKMLKEQQANAVPPKVQEQMQAMGEENKKLAEENLKLKTDKTAEFAKIAADNEATKQELAMKKQVQDEGFLQERLAQEEKQRLAREQFEFDKQLEIEKTQHQLALQKQKDDAANEQKRKELEFEQQCHMEEKQAEQATKDATEAESLAPKLIQSMEAMIKAFTQAMENQNKVNQQLVEAMNKPKTVKLGGIQRGSEGITGASATVN